jgi:hypothetical protein
MLSDPCLKEMPIERTKKSNKSGQGHLSNISQYGLWLQQPTGPQKLPSKRSKSVFLFGCLVGAGRKRGHAAF